MAYGKNTVLLREKGTAGLLDLTWHYRAPRF